MSDIYKKFSSDVLKRTELVRSLQTLDQSKKNIKSIRERLPATSMSDDDDDDDDDERAPRTSRGPTATSVSNTDQARFLAQQSAETRRYRALKIDDLLYGRTKIRNFVDDPKMLDMRLVQIFSKLPRMNKEKAVTLLADAGITPKRRVRGLTIDQYNNLVYILDSKYPGFSNYL